MPAIITVGEILVEIMAKETNQGFTSPGEFLGPYPSGAPAIFIDQTAKMGISSGIIARVGNDDFGQLNINRLRKDGVDVSQIKTTAGCTTGTAFVSYASDGSRKFIFHFAHSAAGMLSPDDIDENYISGAKYLHIMGCSLSANENMRNAIIKAVEIAVKHKVKISFDPNIRPELLGDDKVKAAFDMIVSACDVLLTGAEEALFITDADSPEQAAAALKSKGISVIVVKKGAGGVHVYTDEHSFTLDSYEVEEVDPTGAGDCFDGAFVASLVEGKDVRAAAQIANAAGALGVTKKGPMEGASSKEDIAQFMNRTL